MLWRLKVTNTVSRAQQRPFTLILAAAIFSIQGRVNLGSKQLHSLVYCKNLALSLKKVGISIYVILLSLFTTRFMTWYLSSSLLSTFFFPFDYKAFREVMEKKASAHPFENVQSLLPPHSWLRPYPVPGEFEFISCLSPYQLCTYGTWILQYIFFVLHSNLVK